VLIEWSHGVGAVSTWQRVLERKTGMQNKALQQNRDDAGYSLILLWLRSAEGSR
jgi:hypothetical protein